MLFNDFIDLREAFDSHHQKLYRDLVKKYHPDKNPSNKKRAENITMLANAISEEPSQSVSNILLDKLIRLIRENIPENEFPKNIRELKFYGTRAGTRRPFPRSQERRERRSYTQSDYERDKADFEYWSERVRASETKVNWEKRRMETAYETFKKARDEYERAKESHTTARKERRAAEERFESKHGERRKQERERTSRQNRSQGQKERRNRERERTGRQRSSNWGRYNNEAKSVNMQPMHFRTLLFFIKNALDNKFNIDYSNGYTLLTQKLLAINKRIKNIEDAKKLERQLLAFIQIVKRISNNTERKIDLKTALATIIMVGSKINTYSMNKTIDWGKHAKKELGI